MKTENELKELNATCANALGAYSAASANTSATYDDWLRDGDDKSWDIYSATRDNSITLWKAYVAADRACEEAKKD